MGPVVSKELDAPIDFLEQLGRGERIQPDGGEFESQGKAVEPAAQFAQGAEVGWGNGERRIDRGGPVGQEADGVRIPDRFESAVAFG